MKWEYFKDWEVKGLEPIFIEKLVLLRKYAGIPVIVTSGYRSPEKNKSVIGAIPDSSHTKGLGADIKVASSRQVFLIVMAAHQAGINRIGIYVNSAWEPIHIHLDIDPDKISNVIFIAKEQN